VGKRSRKRRDPAERAAATKAPAKKRPEPKPWPERPSVTRAKNAEAREAIRSQRASRTEQKNTEARAKLKPLKEGERPLAVTIGAIVTALAATANLIVYLGGGEIQGKRPAAAGIIAFTALMYTMTWGLWRARYWAVLGLEALVGILVVVGALSAMLAENVKSLIIALAIVIPCGALFWFLIRAMARIQMPRRPGTE
jgi:cation transport ATPase